VKVVSFVPFGLLSYRFPSFCSFMDAVNSPSACRGLALSGSSAFPPPQDCPNRVALHALEFLSDFVGRSFSIRRVTLFSRLLLWCLFFQGSFFLLKLLLCIDFFYLSRKMGRVISSYDSGLFLFVGYNVYGGVAEAFPKSLVCFFPPFSGSFFSFLKMGGLVVSPKSFLRPPFAYPKWVELYSTYFSELLSLLVIVFRDPLLVEMGI